MASMTESPTLGLTHLQFEAMLTTARESANRYDFALVAMLALLGLRIFEATGTDVADLGEEHGHRVLRVVGKGIRVEGLEARSALYCAMNCRRAFIGPVRGPFVASGDALQVFDSRRVGG